MEGDDCGEAYTAIMRGVGVNHENDNIAGVETLGNVEDNTCGAAMRGCVALSGSGTTSRTKGTRRNLGDLWTGHALQVTGWMVRIGKARSRSR